MSNRTDLGLIDLFGECEPEPWFPFEEMSLNDKWKTASSKLNDAIANNEASFFADDDGMMNFSYASVDSSITSPSYEYFYHNIIQSQHCDLTASPLPNVERNAVDEKPDDGKQSWAKTLPKKFEYDNKTNVFVYEPFNPSKPPTPNQFDLVKIAEVSIPFDQDDNKFTKSVNMLKQNSHLINKLTIAYDTICSDEWKTLEDAIYEHCKDSLTNLTIKNGHKDSLSNCHFPYLTQLTYDGRIASASTTLFTSNPQLKFLNLNNGDEEGFHRFLFNFRDVDFKNAANLVLRTRINYVGAFPELMESIGLYLNGLRSFEIHCQIGGFEIHFDSKSRETTLFTGNTPFEIPVWLKSITTKFTYIIKDGTKWYESYEYWKSKMTSGYDIKALFDEFAEIKVFINKRFSQKRAADIINAVHDKTKLTFYYDINDENVSFKFINVFYCNLKKLLITKECEQLKADFDTNATYVSKDFGIDFNGIAITLIK